MVLPNGGGVYVGTAFNAVSAFTRVHVEHVQLVAHEEVASGETRCVPEHTPRIGINGCTVRTLSKKTIHPMQKPKKFVDYLCLVVVYHLYILCPKSLSYLVLNFKDN